MAGAYVLLNLLARYAFVYGRVPAGDSHLLTHFIEDFTSGVLICGGKLAPVELLLSLAHVCVFLRPSVCNPLKAHGRFSVFEKV
jgi:hypothetical protein